MAKDILEVTVPGHVVSVHTSKQNIILAGLHGSLYILNLACELLKTVEVGKGMVGKSTVVTREGLLFMGDAAGYLHTYNLEAGEIQKQWRPKESVIIAVAVIEGIGVACGYTDGLIRIIDNDIGCVKQVLEGHTASITSLLYLAKENRLISADESDNEIRLWIPSSGQCQHTIKTPVQHLKQIGGIDRFTTASRDSVKISTWKIADGSAAAVLLPPAHVRGTLTIESYCLGGIKGILTCHRDGSIRIWDHDRGIQLYGFETGKKIPFLFPAIPVNVYEHLGEAVHRIVSGHFGGIVKLWRIPAPGSRPAHVGGDGDDGLPCPKGEKILRSEKSDSPVGAARMMARIDADVEIDHNNQYQTVFNIYHLNDTTW